MSSIDDATLLDVVEKLYTWTPDGTSPSMPLDLMADLFGAVSTSFEIIEKATNRPVLLKVGSHLSSAVAQVVSLLSGVHPMFTHPMFTHFRYSDGVTGS